jgi:DNA-binding transcriptional ArsR family regulator
MFKYLLKHLIMLNPQELAKFNKISDPNDKRLSIVFKALGDANRCRILRLFINQKKQLCVSDIAQILKISVAAASQHLKILEITGLIKKDKQGQKVYFIIEDHDPLVRSLIKAVSNY